MLAPPHAGNLQQKEISETSLGQKLPSEMDSL